MASQNTLPRPATRLTDAQITSLVNLVRRAAKTEILPRFRNLTEGQISAKTGPADLVTAADTGAEAMIRRGIQRLFPSAVVLGEEGATDDPELRRRAAGAELAFIVDPVDGTWNFAHGLPLFGVIVAATRFGRPIFGMLYDPITDDWIVASEDGPALQSELARPHRRLSTSPGAALTRMSGFVHLSHMPYPDQRALAPLASEFARFTALRCSCHEYRLMAQGAVDFILSATLNPWDHAAGVLICKRAGGVARFLDDTEYDTARTDGYLLAAPNESTWAVLRDRFAAALDL